MLKVTKVSGPLVSAKITDKNDKPKFLETVYVGDDRLMGEIISIEDGECKIQVYEETSGLTVGQEVELKGELLSVELAPGLLSNMFDGIQRPLEAIDKVSPVFMGAGIHLPSLDREKKWNFQPHAKKGDKVVSGSKIGFVQETKNYKHWIMIPKGVSGEIVEIKKGEFNIVDVIAKVKNSEGESVEIRMLQKWPVKVARSYQKKLTPKKIFLTGQRVIDTMFPIMLGGPVATPGPFGAGKTFTQQQIAKWGNAQIVVYVGCGERGNEMTEMVKLFPTLKDPRTGEPLMDRTVLIANTSNMPIAAREASIYTGVTIAEYYRDMGYDVVMMADSTSRWAESMREISARMEEMPSEEGYPAYLSSRIAAFYERAGVVATNGGDEGSVTLIGTVSPAGGDFSEPVTQASLKNTQVFLALDEKLAAKRHYPSINWTTSYSLYEDLYEDLVVSGEFNSGASVDMNGKSDKETVHKDFIENRGLAKRLLSEEDELLELVKLVGMDGLDNRKRLVLEIAKSIREDFLQQNGFDEVDTYCSFDKCEAMLNLILSLYNNIDRLIQQKGDDDDDLVAKIFDSGMRKSLSDMKYLKTPAEVDKLKKDLVAKAR